MRRISVKRARVWVWAVALAAGLALPAAAQQGTINPRIPPPPPPPEQPAPPPQPEPAPQPKPPKPVAPPASLPRTVVIPAGTRIAVVLDTPLSTRIAKQGQTVTFRTSDPLRVHDLLAVPPETAFTGSVVEVKRPGAFGKSGVLRVQVDRMNLSTGATSEVAARLDSPDMKGHGRLSSDSKRGTDLANLAVYTLEGTLLGAQIKGGKGAAVGAGAGAAIALLIMMSRKGADLYLEPGMPFIVILDRAVELPGAEVYAAQQSYARSRATQSSAAGASSGSDETERNPDGNGADPDRPKLKRRPRRSQP
jgi:hypothetical protein